MKPSHHRQEFSGKPEISDQAHEHCSCCARGDGRSKFRNRLGAELDRWAAIGWRVRVWWRDDDACTDTPMLRRMLDVARNRDLRPALAVIPSSLDKSLIEALSHTRFSIWQHGYSHEFHVQGEFGDGRSYSDMRHDAIAGQMAMDRWFGVHGWQRVFVPPNHMLSVPFKGMLSSLGYIGVSAGEPPTPVLPHVPEVNAEIDLMDWPRNCLHDVEDICARINSALSLRREGVIDASAPLGILTHHLVFDEQMWEVVSSLFDVLGSHEAVEFVPAEKLFEAPAVTAAPDIEQSGPVMAAGVANQITFVITSCGRPDLLERTLHSIFKHYDDRFFEFLVIEDDSRPSPLCDSAAFRDRRIRWLRTGARRGQVAAIDMAYHLVQTPYIFHCEDDWEFYRGGFLSKSIEILDSDQSVLQVWLRALQDTNGHPVLSESYRAGTASYRKLSQCYQSAEYGTWCGFSWNPGLRRRRDYLLLGTFKSLGPNLSRAWEIERAASQAYADYGFSAAILDDEGGQGYVRHIGTYRRIGDPT